MRKLLATSTIGAMVVLLTFFAASCGKEAPAKALDLVKDITPVSHAFVDLDSAIKELAAMKPEDRPAWIKSHFPGLAERAQKWAVDHKMTEEGLEIDHTEIVFGSAEGVEAKDAKGVEHPGFVKDQLVARVYFTDPEQGTVDFILLCANGMVAERDKWKSFQTLQTYTPPPPPGAVDTIGPGQSLATYVSTNEAIDLASGNDLPIYRGKVVAPQFRITYSQALGMIYKNDPTPITVIVPPGSKIDHRGILPEYIPPVPRKEVKQ